MNVIDWIILGILGISVLFGMYRGFVSSVLNMGGGLLSFFGAFLLYPKLAASAVSLCGLLSFVGMIIPNFVRMVSGNHFRKQATLCALYGPAFLLLCDLMARQLFYPYELPAGLILSLIGVPFFITVLVRRKKRLSL